MTFTKLDLTYTISNCVKYINSSNKEHLNALKRLWQYLCTIKNQELLYQDFSSKLSEYIDNNWKNNYSTRNFTIEYISLVERILIDILII